MNKVKKETKEAVQYNEGNALYRGSQILRDMKERRNKNHLRKKERRNKSNKIENDLWVRMGAVVINMLGSLGWS